jgi:glycosyltransferase involved in cell wall biosynthesis
MYNSHVIIVCVPAYNEEARIANVIRAMPDFVDHIIVVDDKSVDRTLEVAQNTPDPRLILIASPVNQGVGGSVIAAYTRALALPAAQENNAIAVKMDGDGQMRPEHLTLLLNKIIDEKFDYAKGNRFFETTYLRQMPRLRILGNIGMTFLTKLASGYWNIFDPQNGYTAITSRALRSLPLGKLHRRYFFENDMLIHLNIDHRRVADAPIPAHYAAERSKLSITRATASFPFLILRGGLTRIFQKYILRDFSPIALFLITGFLLLLWSFIFGSIVWMRSIATNTAAPTGTIMLVVIPLILGFQLVLQAITLDIQNTPR